VFAAYVGFLGGEDPMQRQFYATHLLTASILSAPAAIVFAKILFPETEPEKINTELNISKEKIGSNILDAISNGTTDGLKLAVNVGAMLLAFTAFMYMFNYICKEWIGSWTGLNDMVTAKFGGMYDGFNLQFILGMVFSPLAWILGVSSNDMMLVGQLLGEKTILNEFFAYTTLGKMKAGALMQDQKSIIIATYALCGFSNFASIGIQIGGIGSLAPNQRQTLSELGIKALIGGSFACFMTATIAGMLIG
jgi:concentrative nucleoside transporter, CNT family